ncbi:hypothetical protein [Streptomyces sp. NBC_01217]|uniref:hypothetical protein n=1 Tax=Streptomyces sp. NBC_01217 TaxID=2903779 RepID=UPI002E12FD1C|nr:hypothetical protein OG507_21030 [Streptomyces sp. NBC_01217]
MSTNDEQTAADQTGRSYSSVEISRKVKEHAKGRHLRELREFGAQTLREAALKVLDDLESAQAATRSAVTSSVLAALALDYDSTPEQNRAELGAHVADAIPLAEAGTIRRAAEAIKLATPGIICRATADGMEPNAIARELGATSSYVRRILRENPAMLAEAVKARAEQTNDRTV